MVASKKKYEVKQVDLREFLSWRGLVLPLLDEVKSAKHRWYVYAHFAGDELIYIGFGEGRRFASNCRNGLWIEKVHASGSLAIRILAYFDDREDGAACEKSLIETMKPSCNIVGIPGPLRRAPPQYTTMASIPFLQAC